MHIGSANSWICWLLLDDDSVRKTKITKDANKMNENILGSLK
jgi:hypothetical protein